MSKSCRLNTSTDRYTENLNQEKREQVLVLAIAMDRTHDAIDRQRDAAVAFPGRGWAMWCKRERERGIEVASVPSFVTFLPSDIRLRKQKEGLPLSIHPWRRPMPSQPRAQAALPSPAPFPPSFSFQSSRRAMSEHTKDKAT